MVILAITPDGLRQALQLLEGAVSIWCGSNAISESEYKALSRGGVSRFEYPLSHNDVEMLACAFGTIEEHHPNQAIFVEHIPKPEQDAAVGLLGAE